MTVEASPLEILTAFQAPQQILGITDPLAYSAVLQKFREKIVFNRICNHLTENSFQYVKSRAGTGPTTVHSYNWHT